MTITETIKQALSILDAHDFYYMMADSSYNAAAERAKASMRKFVKVTDTLPADLRQMLRDLWVATYDWCACFRPMWTASDHKEKECKVRAIEQQIYLLFAIAEPQPVLSKKRQG